MRTISRKFHSLILQLVCFTTLFACKTTALQVSNVKITGGNIRAAAEKPEVVPLLISHPNGLQPWCPATLVDSNTLYSAAHCVIKTNGKPMIDSTNFLGILIDQRFIPVSKVYVSSKFMVNRRDKNVSEYDFAILELSQSVDWPTTSVMNQADFPLEELEIVGYGCNNWIKDQKDKLPPPFVAAMNAGAVKWVVKTDWYETAEPDTSKEILTQTPDIQSPNVCPGDSGGALYAKQHLVGVTSRTDHVKLSFFTPLYSTYSQELIKGVQTLRNSSSPGLLPDITTLSYRTNLSEEEHTHISGYLHTFFIHQDYINENMQSLQQTLSQLYGDRLRVLQVEAKHNAFVTGIADHIISKIKNQGIDPKNVFIFPTAITSNSEGFINQLDFLHNKLKTTALMKLSLSHSLEDGDVTINREFALNYNLEKGMVQGGFPHITKYEDEDQGADISQGTPAFAPAQQQFYPFRGLSDPQVLNKVLQTIETLSQEIISERAIFTVLEITAPEDPKQSPAINLKHLYFKAAGQTKLRQIN